MWWNSSSHGRHRSPSSASVSPIPFSSNRELFEDPDADWVGDQLEQARLQRSGFYRRLQSSSQRGDDDVVALQKSRGISPDGADGAGSSIEPHSSWRFYTSFDNGEWTRHAVPVLKAEESTRKIGNHSRQKYGESEVKRSACQAAESSLRRARLPRTTAADRQQARLRMRSGDAGESSVYGRWRLSSSTDNFRDTHAGGSLMDLRRISPEVHHHQSLTSLEVPRVLSPSSERFNRWRESSSPVGFIPRVRLDSGSAEKVLLPVGSCTVDGVDVTFQEKFIVPTKYKNRENNTATGTPETSKPEVPRSTTAEVESGHSKEVKTKNVDGASASCMTGQGEVQAVKSSEQKAVVLFGRVDSKRKETEERRKVELEPPEVTSVRSNGVCDLISDLKHDQFAIVSKFIQETTFDEFSEKYKITAENNEISRAQTTHLITNGGKDSSPNPQPTYEKKDIITEENRKPRVGDTLSNKITSNDAENNVETSSGRSLADDVKCKQKAELTSDMAASVVVSDDQKVSSNGDKIVKFVSTFYADVNKDVNKKPSDTKDKSSNLIASDTSKNGPGPVEKKLESLVSEEDDNWVVEVAVKN